MQAMKTAFPSGGGILQLINAHYLAAKMVQKHKNKFKVLTWSPDSLHVSPIERLWDEKTSLILGGPTFKLKRLTRKDLLLMSWCQIPQQTQVHASIVKGWTLIILVRWL